MRRTIILVAALAAASGCSPVEKASSMSGVEMATAQVQKQASGMTIEQENIRERLKRDNVPGSIKHLYIVSAYSGQVLLYSTVRGKVTSSGKRLSPTTGQVYSSGGMSNRVVIPLGDNVLATDEMIQDDGTYGSSIEYLYWFDETGKYLQFYVTGGVVPIISDHPLRVPKISINVESVADTGQ